MATDRLRQHASALVTRRQLAGRVPALAHAQDRQLNVRRVLRVGEHLEPAALSGPGRAEWLGRTETTRVPGERAPGDLHADPVPREHPVRRREKRHVNRQHAVGAGLNVRRRHGLGAQPSDAVNHVARHTLGVHVAYPDEHVRVRQARANVDARRYLAHEVRIGAQRLAGVGEHVRPGFDGRVVGLLPRRVQQRTAN